MPSKRDNPLWESIVILVSFGFLWAWILFSKAAHAQGQNLGIGWAIVQIAAVAALLIIFIRRVQRAKKAFNEGDARNRPSRPFSTGRANKSKR